MTTPKPTLTDSQIPNRVPENGQLWCRKCGFMQPAEQFRSKQSAVLRYTEFCEDCRARARESMRLHHTRRRAGIQVSRGRPSADGVMFPIKVAYTIPREIIPEVEQMVQARLQQFFEANKTHPQIELARSSFGLTSTAELTPANRQAAPKLGTYANMPRPHNDDQQLFYDTCSPTTKRRLDHIAKADSKSKWKWWDGLYGLWIQDGKLPNYNHKTRKSDPQPDPEATASEPAQPGGNDSA